MNRTIFALLWVLIITQTLAALPYVQDEVLVISSPDAPFQISNFSFNSIEDDASIDQIDEAYVGSVQSQVRHIKSRQRSKPDSPVNVRRIKLRAGIDPITFAKRWQKGRIQNESIQYVQPNYIYNIATITPNDPLSSSGNNFIQLANIDDAWATTTGKSSTIIAVIDTGTLTTHEDLSNGLWINTQETIDGIDNDFNGYIDDINGANTAFSSGSPNGGKVTDDFYHGSHVGGIIIAQLNNNKGIAGVCPSCKLMTIKANIPNKGSFTTSALVAGINYAIEMGASIINMSLGGSPDSDDLMFQTAIQNAVSQSIVVVAAAGNESKNINTNPSIPASFPEVFAVSATDGKTFDSSYSNFGNKILVSAPGTDIASTVHTSNTAYGFANGTSMAAPVVSGVIGLLRSLQPRLTVSEIKTLLQENSDDLGTAGKDIFYGYGFINAEKLLNVISTDTTDPSILSSAIPTSSESEESPTISIVATDDTSIGLIMVATFNYYLTNTLVKTELATVNTSENDTFVFQVPTPGNDINQIKVLLSALDIANNQTSIPERTILVLDRKAPSVSTESSYISDQLLNSVQLSITDPSGIATNSIRVTYYRNADNWESHKSISLDPSTLTFDDSILTVNLTDLGYIPSLSATLSVYVEDTVENGATRNIGIGATTQPAITWRNIANDYVGNGTQLQWIITDPIGVSLNTLNLTMATATQSRFVDYTLNPEQFAIAIPTIAYTLNSAQLPYESSVTFTISIKNQLSAVSTSSLSVQTTKTLTEETVGKHSKFLAYPNPFDPRKTSCQLAYVLSRTATSGELFIYDLSYRKIRQISIGSQYLAAGYNEYPWDGCDDEGHPLSNGTYVVIYTISDDIETVKLRQKIAVLKR